MKRDHRLYEEVFEELSRVYFLFQTQLSDVSENNRSKKLEELFSAFTLEEVICFHESLELL
ncbi:MAG TPA: hypothetical protein GX733_01660 [Tissierellia bacterium]|nr:hypothetical protein [Tissierellia bacterium]